MLSRIANWSFLTNHARALLFIANHPDARLRDIAGALEVTERTAYGIVVDLTEEGYVMKQREGRRNRYQVQENRSWRDPISGERTIGEVLALFVGSKGPRTTEPAVDEGR